MTVRCVIVFKYVWMLLCGGSCFTLLSVCVRPLGYVYSCEYDFDDVILDIV